MRHRGLHERCPSRLPDRTGDVTLAIWLDGSQLVIRIEDDGVGPHASTRDSGLGFGLTIMRQLADTQITDGDGTTVELRFPAQPARPGDTAVVSRLPG